MVEIKNEKIAIPVVLFAGLLWSFGPLIVRYMDQPNQVPWQYLFTRGIVIFLLLNIYLFFEEGKDFYKNYLKAGVSGLIGGCGLALAMITFIYSIINTSKLKELKTISKETVISNPSFASNCSDFSRAIFNSFISSFT